MQGAEFVRGNQKSYIRIPCSTEILRGSDYQMCSYNKMKGLLEFQQRSQNGMDYLYYEISGMQSLDVYLQTQKLRRPFAILLAQAIINLCKEISEYALDIQKVMFLPKYVMIETGKEVIRFVYCFNLYKNGMQGLEQLLEGCIEYLDYQDELLMEQLYGIYERFLEQQDNFALRAEMEAFCKVLGEESKGDGLPSVEYVDASEAFEFNSAAEVNKQKKQSLIFRSETKEQGKLSRGIILLLLVDVGTMLFWKPVTLLKLFFGIAAGVVLLFLLLYLKRRNRQEREEREQQEQEEIYLEEYECLTTQALKSNHYTQIIEVEESEGTLYNLQEREPKYIYINDTQKIIGKDSDKVQVQIVQEGISRIHARVQKEDGECIVEDLNSTNGTWINGKILEPRSKYVLKQGDKVRFAGAEYIFR